MSAVKVGLVSVYVAALLAAAYVRGELGDTDLPMSRPQFWIYAVLAFGSSFVIGAVIGRAALIGPAAALLVIFGLYWLGAPFETFASDPLWGLAVIFLSLGEAFVVVLGMGFGALARRVVEREP